MKNRTHLHSILLFIFALLFFACNPNIDYVKPVTYDYYPLIGGKYKIYKIDSTVYDEYNCAVFNTSYQIKEISRETDFDGEGDLIHLIERYIRKDSLSSWKLQSIWSEKIENNQLQRIENNQRFIKMVFPIKQNIEWDGIVYIRRDTSLAIRGGSINVYKDWDEFKYTKVASSFIDTSTSSPKIYPEAVEIIQADKENKIEKRFAKEVYAKDIGLVYKEMWILNTQCLDSFCTPGSGNLSLCDGVSWKDKAEKGYILVQSLIEHNY